jgi:hypothetical protein
VLCLRNKESESHFVTDDKRDIMDQINPPNSDTTRADGHFDHTTLRIKKRKMMMRQHERKRERESEERCEIPEPGTLDQNLVRLEQIL